jgi:hypothetical protein
LSDSFATRQATSSARSPASSPTVLIRSASRPVPLANRSLIAMISPGV